MPWRSCATPLSRYKRWTCRGSRQRPSRSGHGSCAPEAQERAERKLDSDPCFAGELFVAELETRRLHASGKKQLADRVEHVAATQGDGLGYDVLSFDEDGRERLIEVKTTAFGEFTPFYVSRNELARSEADADCFHLYRLFDFRDRPRLFDLPGSISVRCQLEPVSYLARLAS